MYFYLTKKLSAFEDMYNPNLGGLFRGLFWRGRRGEIIPCLELFRITLESTKALLILLMLAFFLAKMVTLLKAIVLEIFYFCFQFL